MTAAAWAVAVVIGLYLVAPWLVPALGRRWLRYWHGGGERWQYQFYRCHACRRLVTHRLIARGGCRCRESHKVSPAVMTWREKARALYVPWAVR